MRYSDYTKSDHPCPFCDNPSRELVARELAYLTYARAPYHPDHLLIVPRAHRTSLFALTADEKAAIDKLVESGMAIMQKMGYTDFTIIVREGKDVGKSVQHLHYHIIPNTHIGDMDHNGKLRQMLTPEQITAESNKIRKLAEEL